VLKASLQFVLKKWPELSDEDKREHLLQALLEVDKLEQAIKIAEQVAQEVDESVALVIDQEQASRS
jgi:hypothetical protein